MAEIIREAGYETIEEYQLVFTREGCPTGSGYSFECDSEGNMLPTEFEAAKKNRAQALTGEDYDGTPLRREVVDVSRTVHVPAVLRCDCGEKVTLSGFTNTCSRCHADYNSNGTRLGPRHFWGEETGESPGDVLRIP
jgi:hypothetical protein